MWNSSLPLLNLLLLLLLINYTRNIEENEFCEQSSDFEGKNNGCNVQSRFSQIRYILYDINLPEGFNLRRDVYVRIAVFLKNLVAQEKTFQWKLVLPPWENLYHWRSNIGSQTSLPWGMFFDIADLQKYVPVIEMYQFLKEYYAEANETQLDIAYILQNDEEMFKTGKFKNKNEEVECPQESLHYYQLNSKNYAGYFWGYRNITVRILKCIKFHGMMADLEINLKPSLYRTVMFDHMEIALHDFYGSQEYWQARRSMRYNYELYEVANEFRKKYLNSTNKNDNTERPDDWIKEKSRRNATGGPYLSVHLRRRDFLIGRSSITPSIKSAASQIKRKLNELGLQLLFVCTDATEEEFIQLESYLSNYTVYRFVPSNDQLKKFMDGGVAIIDQIIASYARYFIGTHESTFTFRIQEDREIIGFSPETTFNRLCKAKEKCPSSGRWEIVW